MLPWITESRSAVSSLDSQAILFCQLLAVQPQGVLELENKPTSNLIMSLVQTLFHNVTEAQRQAATAKVTQPAPQVQGARKSPCPGLRHFSSRISGLQALRTGTEDDGLLRSVLAPVCRHPCFAIFHSLSAFYIRKLPPWVNLWGDETATVRYYSEADGPEGDTDWQIY